MTRFTAQPDADADAPTLSTQEQAVLSISAKGYSYDEIAGLLKLSRHTVETYVKRIYRELHVHSKPAAAMRDANWVWLMTSVSRMMNRLLTVG